MNLNLPIRTASRRNDESRNHYTSGSYTPTSSTEAIAGPIREPAPVNERLIVGLDFGTTYSGYVYFYSLSCQDICGSTKAGSYTFGWLCNSAMVLFVLLNSWKFLDSIFWSSIDSGGLRLITVHPKICFFHIGTLCKPLRHSFDPKF